jgi:hypothetical protein
MSLTIAAVGLPQTGKTTFLAALWDVIGSGEVLGSLKLEKTDGDMQYLNEIRTAWADCKPIGRTSPAGDRPVTMKVRHDALGESMDLSWTDMLGETFERQWTERVWTRSYQELVEHARGILLFLHPRKVNPSTLILEARPAVEAARAGTGSAKKRPAKNRKPLPLPYSAVKVPTQVQIVELMQFVDEHRSNVAPLRMSVVISAWDLVEKLMTTTPIEWLWKHLPLLAQYIGANDDRFKGKAFGVSAQGCDYKDTAAVDRIRKSQFRTSERIRVSDGKNIDHDITRPVLWAMGADESE